jgi:hypothetical protein
MLSQYNQEIMMNDPSAGLRRRRGVLKLSLALVPAVVAVAAFVSIRLVGHPKPSPVPSASSATLDYQPRMRIDSSGFGVFGALVQAPAPDASLAEVSDAWRTAKENAAQKLDLQLDQGRMGVANDLTRLMYRAMLYHSTGKPAQAGKLLDEVRDALKSRGDEAAEDLLYTVIYFQGVTSLRRGETENCIECRGESSCILPISPAARHVKPDGSRKAIRYFTEYLQKFPDDLEVRWLLNLAHMTLGEYPEKVDPSYLIPLDRFFNSEFDLGRFRDVGHLVGVNRFNQAGGAIMEDFDGDNLLDLAVTSFDPTEPMAFYRNNGDGSFEDLSESVGVRDQLGGLYCVQTDYNNDGRMDIYIPRGAWVDFAMRPTLLRNEGGSFTDVTKEAGLLDPVNSNSAAWADYDNDGWLDLFVCCERQTNQLYHNKRDGTFEEVAFEAGLLSDPYRFCKGATWIDFDNDDDPDLFVNNLNSIGQLYQNDGHGKFTEVSASMGIDGPMSGFSCWSWDYDNDGLLDIFATSYERSVEAVVRGLIGKRHSMQTSKLFRNVGGQVFEDVTRETGLDMVFSTMGSNFADFDNDGWLDMYLATGDPSLTSLFPNRMFRNVAGRRFADITISSGTGHLQKGHAVACGDWDRDGDADMFVETGGAVDGDKFHNVLFSNPGQGNHWLTVKLVGKKTNRAAIGARIKVVTDAETPMTIRRHVSSGSSFGANPLRQQVGLAKATKVGTLEVHWPTSGTTQVFHDLDADQAIEITEFEADYRKLDSQPLPKLQ